MANERTLSVIGYGMWTAAGHDGPSSVAAMQTGMNAARESPLWDFTGGVTLSAFQVNALHWWEGEGFLPELAFQAIKQALDRIAELEIADPAAVPILITVAPKRRPARTEGLEQTLLSGLKSRMGRELPDGSGVHPGGKTGLGVLLTKATAQIAKHPVQIIVGVESLLRQDIVRHYIGENRLMCVANSAGFVPGEAAAALIVAASAATGLPELVLQGMAEAQEKTPLTDDGPPAATGLTTAIRSALRAANTPMHDVGTLFSDLNGEHGKFKDNLVAVMRNDALPPEGKSRRPKKGIEHWNAAEAIGEVGAAFLPAALGWAFEAGRQGLLQLPKILAYAGEDDGSRIAIVGEFSG